MSEKTTYLTSSRNQNKAYENELKQLVEMTQQLAKDTYRSSSFLIDAGITTKTGRLKSYLKDTSASA